MGGNRIFALGVLVGVALLPFALRLVRALFGFDEDKRVDDDIDRDDSDSDDSDSGDDIDPTLAGDDAASEHFFEQWLGASMMLSSARFDDEVDERVDLAIAQHRMMNGIALQLDLQPGMRILEIESGWGEFALFLAERYRVQVTGVSRQAIRVQAANRRAAGADVEHTPHFIHGHANEVIGTFHRIIRIALSEMEEPVPVALYHGLLEEDGRALVHAATGPRLPPIHDLFEVEHENITNSFARTFGMWSTNLDAGWHEGQLELFETRTLHWQRHITRLADEIQNEARGLEQVVYTKRPLSSQLGGRTASRGVVRRHDGRVVAAQSNPNHLPAAM